MVLKIKLLLKAYERRTVNLSTVIDLANAEGYSVVVKPNKSLRLFKGDLKK